MFSQKRKQPEKPVVDLKPIKSLPSIKKMAAKRIPDCAEWYHMKQQEADATPADWVGVCRLEGCKHSI